jgi:S1-C subfamily serine protease
MRLIFMGIAFGLCLCSNIPLLAQNIRVTCETEYAVISDHLGKEITNPFTVKAGTYKLVRAEKKGHRPRCEVILGSSDLAKRGYQIGALVPYPSAEMLNHDINPGNINFEVGKGDIRIVRFNNPKQEAKSGTKPVSELNSSDRFFKENEGVSVALDKLITRMSLGAEKADEEEFFTNYERSLRLSAVIERIELKEYVEGGYAIMELRTKWKVNDYFGGTIMEQAYKSESNPLNARLGYMFYMASTSSALLNYIENSLFEDALEQSMMNLLTDEDFLKKLQDRLAELEAIGKKEVILLPSGSAASGLSNQRAACVTIKRKDMYGSGCVISPDGYIVTNYHVSGDGASDTLTVEMNDGTTHTASVVRTDPVYDLALIKINSTGLKTLRPEKAYKPLIGEKVYAIGTPADAALGQTITRGVLSAVRSANGREYIQTDANVSPGNSGGALVTHDGRLIGIVSSKAFGSIVEGVGFAVPAKDVFQRLNIDFK